MMLGILLIPAVLMLTAGVGWLTCIALAVSPHRGEMLMAGGSCLLSSEVAMIPLMLVRGRGQPLQCIDAIRVRRGGNRLDGGPGQSDGA